MRIRDLRSMIREFLFEDTKRKPSWMFPPYFDAPEVKTTSWLKKFKPEAYKAHPLTPTGGPKSTWEFMHSRGWGTDDNFTLDDDGTLWGWDQGRNGRTYYWDEKSKKWIDVDKQTFLDLLISPERS